MTTKQKPKIEPPAPVDPLRVRYEPKDASGETPAPSPDAETDAAGDAGNLETPP